VDFFEDLARHWKGWEGEKRWCSVEKDFVLSAAFDSVGHVMLQVTLRSGPYDDDWIVETALTIESGQLEKVEGEMKLFLHTGAGA
jgi:Family of unknown function (DUF6228)